MELESRFLGICSLSVPSDWEMEYVNGNWSLSSPDGRERVLVWGKTVRGDTRRDLVVKAALTSWRQRFGGKASPIDVVSVHSGAVGFTLAKNAKMGARAMVKVHLRRNVLVGAAYYCFSPDIRGGEARARMTQVLRTLKPIRYGSPIGPNTSVGASSS
jgi:hypothetical protein